MGYVFPQVGQPMARALARAQYCRKTVTTEASEDAHLKSFDALWQGLDREWRAALSTGEAEAFGRLETDSLRDAFRIVRGYAYKAAQESATDFPIARDDLGARLGITGPGAGKVRDRLAQLGVICRTAECRPNKAAARYRWLLPPITTAKPNPSP